MPLLTGIFASAISGHLGTADAGSMVPLSAFTLPSAQANVEFTNIPQTYTHLQLRINWGYSNTSNNTWLRVQFNGDTTSSYSTHALRGNGSSTFATAVSSQAYLSIGSDDQGSTSAYGVSVADILDYRNTNKNKVTRALSGQDRNGAGAIGLWSGLWTKTNAITSIKIFTDLSNFTASSSFALYGIKGE